MSGDFPGWLREADPEHASIAIANAATVLEVLEPPTALTGVTEADADVSTTRLLYILGWEAGFVALPTAVELELWDATSDALTGDDARIIYRIPLITTAGATDFRIRSPEGVILEVQNTLFVRPVDAAGAAAALGTTGALNVWGRSRLGG